MYVTRRRRSRNSKKNERGVALFIALFALLLLAAVASGMMFMSSMETNISYNYRDSQTAYFAAAGGLEEARDRIRTGGDIPPPRILPTTTNQAGVIYIVNPAAGETVAPWDVTNAYFDDEFCHENFKVVGGTTALTNPGNGIPCAKTYGTGIPANSPAWYTSFLSADPGRGTNAALPYKWVRITMKENDSLSAPAVTTGLATYLVNNDASNATDLHKQVCWNGTSEQL